MKKIWKSHKLAIIIIGYCLVVFLVLFFLAVPFIKKIEEKADNIQKEKINNEINRERIEKISQMEEIDKLIQSKNEELNVILDLEDEVGFIKDLESLAEETGNKMSIKIEDLEKNSDAKSKKSSSEKKKDKKTIRESLSYDSYIFMVINLEGNYQEMLDFVHKLENFKRYVNIISVEIKKETEFESVSAPPVVQNPSIFSVSTPKSDERLIEKKEKNILLSTINIIVYKKK